MTSQSTRIVRSPNCVRSAITRRLRPTSRWISCVRPDCLPSAASRRARVVVARGMLPRATNTRARREAAEGRQSGRTQEIQRLVGRSLRVIADLTQLGERTIRVDCDVIQADGGTRCASITGACVAVHDAVAWCKARGLVAGELVSDFVAAVSVGIVGGAPLLDLDYAEDAGCDTDMNVVMTGRGGIVEVQGTAEAAPFTRAEMDDLVSLAQRGIGELVA